MKHAELACVKYGTIDISTLVLFCYALRIRPIVPVVIVGGANPFKIPWSTVRDGGSHEKCERNVSDFTYLGIQYKTRDMSS